MSNLIKNTTIYAIGDILPRLFSFVTFPILTTYLSPADYGVINYINTLNVFLMVFSVLCLNTYYLVFFYRQPDEESQKRLLGNLSVFVVGFTVILSVIALAVGYYTPIGSQSDIPFYPYIAIGIGINICNVIAVLPLATYRVHENPLPLTIINVVRGVIVMLLTLFVVAKLGYRSLGVLYVTLIINALFAVLFIYITLKNAKLCFDWKQLKKALSFSLPLVPGSLAYYLVSISDRILIEKYVDLDSLGIYSTASTLALILNIVSYGAYKAFEPYFFKIYGTEYFYRQFQRVHDAFFFILLIGATCLAMFSKEFFELFSSEAFHVSYKYVPLLLIGVLSSSMSMLYGTIVTARERTKISSVISIVGGVLSVCLNIVLLPYLGILGAGITSSFCLTAMMLAHAYYAETHVSCLRSLCALVLISLMCIVFVYFLQIDSLVISIMIKATVTLVVCFICSFIMKLNLLKILKIYGTLSN